MRLSIHRDGLASMTTIILILTLSGHHMMHVVFDDRPACEAALEQVKAIDSWVRGVCVPTTSTLAGDKRRAVQ